MYRVIIVSLSLFVSLSLVFSVSSPAYSATLRQVGIEELDLSPDNTEFDKAYANHSQKVELSVQGKVIKILDDDTKGSKHQKFIISVNDRHILVANNIDLNKKVPLKVGDEVTIRGEYIWNEKGGVLHWTHRDPQKKHADGFIYHNGKLYK